MNNRFRQFVDTKVSLQIPCDGTVDGTCSTAQTLEECINKCKAPVCYWGMYSSRTKSCAPVNYATHKLLNPNFILKPEKDVTTFVDSNFFEYPAQRKDRLFYYDKIRIQNVETGIIIPPDVVFRPTKPYIPHPGLDFIPIQAGSPVLFYDRRLDSVLRAEGLYINWYKSIDVLNEDYEAFFLEPVDPDLGFTYQNTFRIRTSMLDYMSLPPLYNFVQPRLNDLIIEEGNNKNKFSYKFLYIPTPVINAD